MTTASAARPTLQYAAGSTWVKSVRSVSRWSIAWHAEVDHLGHRLAVVQRHQHVGGLDVAVDDPLLVGVLDRLADRDEQLEPLPRREAAASQYSVIGTPLTSSITK